MDNDTLKKLADELVDTFHVHCIGVASHWQMNQPNPDDCSLTGDVLDDAQSLEVLILEQWAELAGYKLVSTLGTVFKFTSLTASVAFVNAIAASDFNGTLECYDDGTIWTVIVG